MSLSVSLEQLPEARQRFLNAQGFVAEFYNHDLKDPDVPSLPHEAVWLPPGRNKPRSRI